MDFESFRDLHGGFVDPDESHGRVVRRPPVTGVAVHLFLGDELGHAVANQPAAVLRQAKLLERFEIDGVQVLVADERHVPPRGAELRIRLS